MGQGLSRRKLLAVAGLTVLMPAKAPAAPARKTLALELAPRELSLRPGKPATPAWRFANTVVPRFVQGDEVDVTIVNRLPVAVAIRWRGLDGAPALEPLLARKPIAAGASEGFILTLRHAGTLICDARLMQDGVSPHLPLMPVVVTEAAAPVVDLDEVLLIEDWRLLPDGREADVEPIYTINGEPRLKIPTRPDERLRLRFINGTQRTVFAVQLPEFDVSVIAIDGQPSEPILARDRRLVMAPGSRIDAIVDVTVAGSGIVLSDGSRSIKIGDFAVAIEPRRAIALPRLQALPSNGLPDRLALQSALRVDLALNGSTGWMEPKAMTAATAPAFRVKRDRAVVLALNNPSDTNVIFHLHGHHMRLLDRLDDGWKPFWLDTVAVPAKQTLRVAFGATHPGAYLFEMYAAGWDSPKFLKHYVVDA